MALRESEKLYTVEEFNEIAALPENDERRLELEDGVIINVGSSSLLNTATAMRIGILLGHYVLANDLGIMTGADGGYQLAPKRVRRPDVGFISKTHHLKLTGIESPIAPDLAVEVVSPHEDVYKKVKEYLLAGTRIVWVVYAEEQTIDVFTPVEGTELHVQQLTVTDTLDGGDVLPGLTLPVRDIFPAG